MTNILLTTTSTPNFCDKDGNAYLVRCTQCSEENYTINVPTGICTWCGWDLNKHKVIQKTDEDQTRNN